MPRPERLRRRGSGALAAGILLSLTAAMMPVTRVIEPGGWVPGALTLATVMLATGALLRRARVPAVGVSLVESALFVLVITVAFFRDTAWFGVIPTPDTLRAVPVLLADAVQQMATGAAPLPASDALSFFVVASVGVLTLVLDHVVVTTRLPLLGAVALVAVALVPTIAVPAPMDVGAFVVLGIGILFLLRTDTRARHAGSSRRPSTASATGVAIGAVAVIVAVVLTPLLPAPESREDPIAAGSSGINPTLRLGDDLRRPNPVEVLRVRTTASTAPYLRAVTLSSFAGEVWRPDEQRPEPVDSAEGFGPVPAEADVARAEQVTRIDIERLSSTYLPLPYPATDIGGLRGDWGLIAENRTVVAMQANTSGQGYEVLTEEPRPTLEQIRGARARGAAVSPDYVQLPVVTPELIGQLAREVTADARTDYDAVTALQRWFRSSAFSYSLDAPVEEGFDGAGVDAVERFLVERTGYCVHFASAFAVMARSLDIPTRVVIGYLPGADTPELVDDQVVYSVTSDLLHSWPEVYFEGIGWVGFEPTNSLGSPPTFSSGATTPGGAADQELGLTPEQTEAPSVGPSERPDLPGAAESGAVQDDQASPTAVPGIVALALVALLGAPGVVRAMWRRRQLTAASGGDERAAWRVVQDTAIDLGIPVPASESPRSFGARLVAAHGAPPDAVDALVTAVEHASYAPAGSAWSGAARDGTLASAVDAVRGALRAGTPLGRRLLAVLVPRSLVVRPGSATAGAREPSGAR
ncbi:transglutaminase TgpA family protein [Microbacterium caowuchunii]|uniref:Transglutaminase domain-containing protein n=1 Tax=Microbacterium caowuchunii TaxID=2614638 RepID=A0A5N0T8V7_9MICO|nr:DUF3488 and transglutaminase-like domain-containing protein [Microbacterium caowuchunii]KAA9131191.1 transglutaminase domain-containing protein [Microbacterium caowuchunii]